MDVSFKGFVITWRRGNAETGDMEIKKSHCTSYLFGSSIVACPRRLCVYPPSLITRHWPGHYGIAVRHGQAPTVDWPGRVIMAFPIRYEQKRRGMPLRVVLDTDPGIDDSLAILLALASPEIDLAAVGVTGGNCSMTDGVRNALN